MEADMVREQRFLPSLLSSFNDKIMRATTSGLSGIMSHIRRPPLESDAHCELLMKQIEMPMAFTALAGTPKF
jgi:hypothetical protein